MTKQHAKPFRAVASRIKWWLIRCLVAADDMYMRFTETKPLLPKGKQCIVVTVAFNKPELIKLQYQSLKKNLGSDFGYLVYDNSTEAQASEELERFSRQNGFTYFKPGSKLAGRINPSIDHAIALDWCAKAIAKHQEKLKYALFLDHDIFLTERWLLSDVHSPGIVLTAPKQERGGVTYYWPGLMLVATNFASLKVLSFLPEQGLDTGGKIGKLAKMHKILTADIPHCGYINTRNGSGIKNTDSNFGNLLMRNQIIEAYGPWLHLINGSGWRGTSNQKESLEYIRKKIDKVLD
jgi:hypothetical protein